MTSEVYPYKGAEKILCELHKTKEKKKKILAIKVSVGLVSMITIGHGSCNPEVLHRHLTMKILSTVN